MVRGLTVTIVAKNEEERIQACLESVAWAPEIVVVDAESTDRTAEIARKFTPKVIVRPWAGFAAQKNFALTQATEPWILSLDADEQVPPELREEIRGILEADGPLDGYSVPRKNVFLGRWIRHGTWFPDYQLRLFRRGAGVFRAVSVHESVEVTSGRLGHLRTPLLHVSYRDIADFVQRSNRYSTLAAQDLARAGTRVSWWELLLRPVGRFCSMYVLHRGFLDGREGFVLALLYSYYVFLRTAKAWALGRSVRRPPDPA
ncbi:MAG TPA: glycosyltransferase family 2 protein [Methylomirabilota bacterium]|jgi:glycosyltransferase involved in cell wall biosynthesis|nr:glycosyltransferase family 2 protein [Methylomirabilota bacterium]